MEVWLEGLAMHVSVGAVLPQDLKMDIYNYSGKIFCFSSFFVFFS